MIKFADGTIRPIISRNIGAYSAGVNGSRYMAKASDGTLWAVFVITDSTATDQIWAAYSTDGGSTWILEQLTSAPVDNSQSDPALAIDSVNDIHVVWSGYDPVLGTAEIYYRKRESGVWQPSEAITIGSSFFGQREPAIGIDSADDVHITWNGYGDISGYSRVWYVKKGGAVEQVSPAENRSSYSSALAIDSTDNIHVAFLRERPLPPAARNIFYRKRIAAGWQAMETVTNKTVAQSSPCVAIDSNDFVHIAWAGFGWGVNTGYDNIQYSRREAAAADWAANQVALTDEAVHQYAPSIALTTVDDVSVAWHGSNWGVNSTKLNVQLVQRVAGVWQAQVAMTDTPYGASAPNLLWSRWPVDNILVGYAFIYNEGIYVMAVGLAGLSPAHQEMLVGV